MNIKGIHREMNLKEGIAPSPRFFYKDIDLTRENIVLIS